MKRNKMKHFITVTLTAFLLIGFTACSGGKNSPEGVTKDFLTAMQKVDLEKAKELCAPETASLITMMETYGKAEMEKAKLEAKDKGVKEIKIISSKIDGDKAKVVYTAGDEKEETMDLKKIDGKWKVSVDKEGMNKEQ